MNKKFLISLILVIIFCFILPSFSFTESDKYEKEYNLKEWDNITQEISSVEYDLVNESTAYIRIKFFSWQTGTEMEEVIHKLKERKIDKIILDLRNNQGGIIYSAIEIAELFVLKGKICTVELNDGTIKVFNSELAKIEFKLIVLINGITTSTAELLASAIKDSQSGVLVGHKTYGKSSIQQITLVEGDKAIQQTVGRYITRNEKDIDGKGISPDYSIYNTTELLTQYIEGKEEYILVTKDSQLNFAIELLSKK